MVIRTRDGDRGCDNPLYKYKKKDTMKLITLNCIYMYVIRELCRFTNELFLYLLG